MKRLYRIQAMFKTAKRSLQMHKLRSLLTVLGLVFGVASVIVMLAVTEGASQESQRQIASLGVNNIIVRSVKPSDNEFGEGQSFRSIEVAYGLTYDDLRRINDAMETVVGATPLREYQQELRNGSQRLYGRVVGVMPSFHDSNRLTMARGRFVDDADLKFNANVCVIGEEVAKQLFLFENPIGKSVQVGSQNFYRIIGVTRYKTPSAGVGSSLSAQDLNKDIYIPITTDRSRNGDVITKRVRSGYSRERMQLSQITVQVRDTALVKPTAAALESLLTGGRSQRDFAITVPLDLLEQAAATQRIFNIVLGATAAISLLVGGIGIMNIMLASVSERTQEIGIRRALGAKQNDIVMQFLFETAALSFIGTFIGLWVGLATPSLVSWVTGMETKITAWSPLIAASVAFSVGMIFGIYPAQQAAKLDPIEALRHA
ncbi:MAG TPA: ABC transporter permease [Pirellulaceae bacterium]|nr:ABC transporter permease [Pirellulaceae bacterium]HMO93341.1 ABC transporter permease [Pirellulaceae bacterium]HMP70112.1 ABC transporter permease [Pirellulaceae bacterium]